MIDQITEREIECTECKKILKYKVIKSERINDEIKYFDIVSVFSDMVRTVEKEGWKINSLWNGARDYGFCPEHKN